MICFVLYVFSILVSVSGQGEEATAPYKPADVILINCGATSVTIDTDGRTWMPEQEKILPSNSNNTSFSSDASYAPGIPQVPYMTARVIQSDFTYSFPVSPGSKFIRLYFYPEPDFDAVNSFFSVSVNGFTLLKNFSADLTEKASKAESTLIKEFIVPVYKTLNLTFTLSSVTSFAFVNGIEIVSMPDRFYSKGGFDNMVNNVSSDVGLEIDNWTAFETVYRLNVGGNMVTEVHDSGMFRRWLSDYEFLLGKSGIIPYVPDVMINYTEKTPAYVAPAYVYATCRTMGNAQYPELNLNFNMTWLFTVDAGFNYLVRLHFCETLQEVNASSQRVFSIFLENKMAKKKMDAFWLSGGSQIPMYLDFSVYVGSENGPRPDLRLDLYPLKDIKPKYYDAILNGVEILKLNNSDGNLAGPNPNPPLSSNLTPNRVPPHMKDKSHVPVIIFIVVGSTIGLVTFIFVLLLSMREMKRKRGKENSVFMFKVSLKHYTYTELKKITKSFSHTLGKGGFGTVYGGHLCNGHKVAVKVLKDSKGNGEDFINEVASMSQTSHVNIVSLLGFCYEGSKRAIVYEFLENGSLDQFMSRKDSLTLDMTTLYGIALGIARGLEYLHYGCKTRIVHFDIKPQNILLDENLCPKVSDFGLAKLCEKRESILSLIDARGTIGYIAPEVFARMYGRVSHKSDVYSYGMLVLEMIGARNKKIVETIDSAASSTYFPDWIYKDLEEGKQTWIFGDEITMEEKEIARKMILVGLWCIQPCPSDRPPMNRVVEMIEGSVDALEIPPKLSMHISSGLIAESSSLSDYGEAAAGDSSLSPESKMNENSTMKIDQQNEDLNNWLPVTASRKAKWWYSAFHNVTAMVGAGVLGLPFAISQLGWVSGIGAILGSWGITFYTFWQLVELHESVPGKRFDRYSELGQHAFGPKLGCWIVMPQQMLVQVGTDIVYNATGGKSLKKAIELLIPSFAMRNTYYILIFTAIQLGLSQIPNFNSLKGVSLLAAVMSVCYTMIAFVASTVKGTQHHPSSYGIRSQDSVDIAFDVMDALGTVAFAFAGHSVVLEIQATIPSTPEVPSKKPTWKGVVMAYAIVLFCYLTVAISGFWAFGNLVEDDILISLHKPSWLIAVTNFMVFLHVTGSYQVFAMPVFDGIESCLVKTLNFTPSTCLRIVGRSSYVALVGFIAVCIPFFGGLLGFFGGLVYSSTSYFLPCIIWLVMKQPKRWSFHWIASWISIIVGVLIAFLAPIGGARQLVLQAKTYKMFS